MCVLLVAVTVYGPPAIVFAVAVMDATPFVVVAFPPVEKVELAPLPAATTVKTTAVLSATDVAARIGDGDGERWEGGRDRRRLGRGRTRR